MCTLPERLLDEVTLFLHRLESDLQEEQQEELVPVPTDHDNAVAEKDELIASLKDIEMDFQMGKLSQSDYEALKKEFELRAVAALKKLDRIGGGTARSKESES